MSRGNALWRPARAVLAAVLTVGLLGIVAPADAQKRGGTLTIVRPTDPVSLDPQPRPRPRAPGSTTTSWSRSSPSTRR